MVCWIPLLLFAKNAQAQIISLLIFSLDGGAWLLKDIL
jgi:hypothetical protein